MKPRWQYQDIIDLEYFLHGDRTTQETELQQRDRDIYLALKKSGQPAQDDADLLRAWIQARRQTAAAQDQLSSPGHLFQKLEGVARVISPVKGLLIGTVTGFAFFSYNGTTPINVFHFLLLFVVSQLLLTTIYLGTLLFHRLRGKNHQWGAVTLLGKSLAASTRFILRRRFYGLLTAAQRTSLEHVFGKLRAGSGLYGRLFTWPFLIMVQLFGIAFNIGLVGITLIKIATSDLAFGWQSTLSFSDQFLAHLVEYVALPWSWIPGSFPSLSQIEGSRIILKDAITQLTTGDLTAWWPFLVMSLICYGLLPRLALFTWMVWRERKVLRNLRPETPACQRLLRRMRTPQISTQAAAQPTGTHPKDLSMNTRSMRTSQQMSAIVLIPDDISGLCNAEWLESTLDRNHFRLHEEFHFMLSYEKDLQLVALLCEKQYPPGINILIIMEGWMVPLQDFLSLLRKLRQELPKLTVSIGLLGKPEAAGFAPLKKDDLEIWQNKIEGMGDPYIDLFPFGETA